MNVLEKMQKIFFVYSLLSISIGVDELISEVEGWKMHIAWLKKDKYCNTYIRPGVGNVRICPKEEHDLRGAAQGYVYLA